MKGNPLAREVDHSTSFECNSIGKLVAVNNFGRLSHVLSEHYEDIMVVPSFLPTFPRQKALGLFDLFHGLKH